LFGFVRTLIKTIFQTDKSWESRVLAFTLAWGVAWAVVGGGDALLVRVQETSYSLTGSLLETPWVYYAGLTLHAIRFLFGFAQQIEMGVFVFLAVKLTNTNPTHRWVIWISLIMINASIFLLEGPISPSTSFLDTYFSATGWDSLAPLGVPGYSQYVVSVTWWAGWLLLELSTFLWGAWVMNLLIRNLKGKFNYISIFVFLTTLLFFVGYLAPFVSTNWEWLSAAFGIGLNTLWNQTIFWFFGHSVVYMLFLPAVVVLYYIIPLLVNRPIYSEKMAVGSAVLYFAFSDIVPIHHLYLTVFPAWVNLAQELMTYGVVVPSIMTFFNLWATVKGVGHVRWTVPLAFAVFSFGGAIAAGVTGVANATVSVDAIIHNTMWVVGHFHAMIDLMIVPGIFALLYMVQPVIMNKGWFSRRLAWGHFWLTLIGGAGISVFMDSLGLDGILRRSMTFPLIGTVTSDEILLTVFALAFGLGQILFVLNVVGSMYGGRPMNFEGLSFDKSLLLASSTTTWGESEGYIEPPPASGRVSHLSKRRAELTWTALAVSLLALNALITAPVGAAAGGALSTVPSSYLDPGDVTDINVVAHQYFWTFIEGGQVTTDYFVVNPGAHVLVNGTTALGNALANLYMPLFNDKILDNELYQGYNSYLWFDAPVVPGVYGFMNGEYDGPYYTYMGGEMLVMAQGGLMNQDMVSEYNATLPQDPYTPPAVSGSNFLLKMSSWGAWNDSDPAPTLLVKNGTTDSISFTVSPDSVMSLDNYLLNITSSDYRQQIQNYLEQNDFRLPYLLEIIHIDPSGGYQRVAQAQLVVGQTITLSFQAQPGAYVYGIIQPIYHYVNPDGLSGYEMGSDAGYVDSLWGMVLVTQ
jgi:heme/copper-type cytochrome/quinol oxidase subunit 1